MEALRFANERLEEVEGRIRGDLARLEETALKHMKRARTQVERSPVRSVDLKLNENFHEIESFGNKLKTVADESDCALNGLKRAVNVVETVTVLYNSASRALEQFENEDTEEAFREIERYIAEVERAKGLGHWEDALNVVSRGYIGQVISGLKSHALESLKANQSKEHSKLLTRLAVSLSAEHEAYESYLFSVKLESDRKVDSSLVTASGGEVACLKRIIQKARTLLLNQAGSVLKELGPTYYLKIAREIHQYASNEVSRVFADFVRLNFGQILGHSAFDPLSSYRSDLESPPEKIIGDLEKALTPSVVEAISSDVSYQKILDTIAVMASLWTDFESALRDSTTPVYRDIFVKDDGYGTDGLVVLSDATRNLQSVLAAYVQLQHAFTLKAVVQAIQATDTIYMSQDENTLTSTLVDDVFFILQKSQQRSIATGDIQTACATFNQISGIISNEVKTALMDNLVQSQPIYERWTQKFENLAQGSLYSMLDEYFRRTRGTVPETMGSKYSFVHSLNNIEECLGLLSKFKQEMTECFSNEFLKDNPEKNLLVDNTIQALDLVKTELEQIMETCCNYALNMFKDHLTEALNRFASVDFEMDEDKYAKSQNEDSFVDLLVGVLRVILGHISTYYTPKVGLKCMRNLLDKVCKYIETRTLSKRFTVYGAVYFDGGVRALVYACSSFSQEIRKQFAALLQISDVLNVNNSDDLMLLKESEYTIDIAKYSRLRTDLAF